MSKSRIIRRSGNVAHFGEIRNAYRIFVWKLEGKKLLWRPISWATIGFLEWTLLQEISELICYCSLLPCTIYSSVLFTHLLSSSTEIVKRTWNIMSEQMKVHCLIRRLWGSELCLYVWRQRCLYVGLKDVNGDLSDSKWQRGKFLSWSMGWLIIFSRLRWRESMLLVRLVLNVTSVWGKAPRVTGRITTKTEAANQILNCFRHF